MTVKEIAGLAGVSAGTVDRVLYKRGRVSAATQARVEAIIERYQFTPNPIARQLKKGRGCHFSVLIPRRDQDSGYWELVLEGIKKGAEEIKLLGAETEIIEYDRYNFREAQAVADMTLAKNPDGVCLAPIVLIKQAIPKIQEKGVPLVFFDSGFPAIKPLCTISQNPLGGGYLAGRLMNLFSGGAVRLALILDAHSQDYHIMRRRDGFLRYAKEHNFPALVKEYSEEGELSKKEIFLLLQEHPGLTGIFVTNSLAHRVAEAAKNIRGKRKFFIIGYDLTQDNRRLLKEGFIDAIISQRPEEQGRLAVVNLYRHSALSQNIEARVEMPLDIYIRENIQG
jgi:LacI family transcriptional regulator